MSKESEVINANVLVLCSNESSIKNYKSVQVVKGLCEKTDEQECNNWTTCFYYAGVDIPESFNNSQIDKQVGTITSNNVFIRRKILHFHILYYLLF